MASAPVGSAPFGKVMTAMITPFKDDGSLDAAGAAELARWLVAHGSDGLVLAGTTGETSTLDDEEKLALWRAVRDAVDVPLLAGSGSNDTAHSVELSRRAVDTGVDGLLLVVPYYNRPSQAGIVGHVEAVAGATDLPVVLYDVPARTGRAVEVDVILKLAHEVPNLVGMKDARGNLGDAARIISEAPDGWAHYSGDDVLTLPLLSVGAVGVVGVAAHWSGVLHSEMLAAFDKGDVRTAREINARLLSSYAAEGIETPTSAAKAAMAVLGKPAGPCRLPLAPVADELRQHMHEIVVDLGVTP